MHSLNAGLYWLLPGPRSLIEKIATQITSSRVLVVNLPKTTVPGTREGITRGLQDAHFPHPIRLLIRSGTDIASDVGVHFGEGNRRVTAAELARVHLASASSILLQPDDAKAQALCDAYTVEFMAATGHTEGNVHLATTIHDASHQGDGHQNDIHLITFDGGLTPDEMDAYVSLRMINRPGPGSTRLLRAIISEFAGFDALFAERLMLLDDSQILAIRDHLGLLLGEDHERWRTLSWLTGTRSIVTSQPHLLHDFYLAEHGMAEQKVNAKGRIDRRYWRACLKAVTPWSEERRSEVVKIFLPQLRQIAARHPKGKIAIPQGDFERLVESEDIEYNNISGMAKRGLLDVKTENERRAVNICRKTKLVRDDIAHLRAPKPELLSELIQAMDGLVHLE